jgi:hypothetical protein
VQAALELALAQSARLSSTSAACLKRRNSIRRWISSSRGSSSFSRSISSAARSERLLIDISVAGHDQEVRRVLDVERVERLQVAHVALQDARDLDLLDRDLCSRTRCSKRSIGPWKTRSRWMV